MGERISRRVTPVKKAYQWNGNYCFAVIKLTWIISNKEHQASVGLGWWAYSAAKNDVEPRNFPYQPNLLMKLFETIYKTWFSWFPFWRMNKMDILQARSFCGMILDLVLRDQNGSGERNIPFIDVWSLPFSYFWIDLLKASSLLKTRIGFIVVKGSPWNVR